MNEHKDGTTLALVHNWCEIGGEWNTYEIRIPDALTCDSLGPNGEAIDADALSRFLDGKLFGYHLDDPDYEDTRWQVDDWSTLKLGEIITLKMKSRYGHTGIVIVDMT